MLSEMPCYCLSETQLTLCQKYGGIVEILKGFEKAEKDEPTKAKIQNSKKKL
jgi:hypothetical protein